MPAAEWALGSGSLTVSFAGGGGAARGASTPEVLRPSTVAMPTLTFDDAAAPGALFTALVLDRDAPNASVPLRGPLRHMALAGLSREQLRAGVSWDTLDASAGWLFNYSGPNPGAGSGCHRYYVMLYAQSAALSPSIPPEQSSRFAWDFPAWAASQSLTKVASATTYWRTQNWTYYAGPCDSAPPAARAGGLSAGAAVGVAAAVLVGLGAGAGAYLRLRKPPAERLDALYESMSASTLRGRD